MLKKTPRLIFCDPCLMVINLETRQIIYQNPDEKIASGLSVSEDEQFCGYVFFDDSNLNESERDEFERDESNYGKYRLKILNLETYKCIEFHHPIEDNEVFNTLEFTQQQKKFRVFFHQQKAIIEFLDPIENRYCLTFFDIDTPENIPKYESLIWPFQCMPNMPFGFYTDGFLKSVFVTENSDLIPKYDHHLAKVPFREIHLSPNGHHYVALIDNSVCIFPIERFAQIKQKYHNQKQNLIFPIERFAQIKQKYRNQKQNIKLIDFLSEIQTTEESSRSISKPIHITMSSNCRIFAVGHDGGDISHTIASSIFIFHAESCVMIGKVPPIYNFAHLIHITNDFILFRYQLNEDNLKYAINIGRIDLRTFCPILKLWDLIPQGLSRDINPVWWNFCRGHLLYDPRLFLIIRNFTALQR